MEGKEDIGTWFASSLRWQTYLSLFYFQVSGLVFFVPFFQTRTANPVIRFLPRTEYTLMGCQGVGGGEGGPEAEVSSEGGVDTQWIIVAHMPPCHHHHIHTLSESGKEGTLFNFHTLFALAMGCRWKCCARILRCSLKGGTCPSLPPVSDWLKSRHTQAMRQKPRVERGEGAREKKSGSPKNPLTRTRPHFCLPPWDHCYSRF